MPLPVDVGVLSRRPNHVLESGAATVTGLRLGEGACGHRAAAPPTRFWTERQASRQ